MAYHNVHQDIRRDEMWGASWWMVRFVKQGYRLSNQQLECLEAEKNFRTDSAINSVMELTRIAAKDARGDFYKWFKKGVPFNLVLENSLKKSNNNPEGERLCASIAVYCCAAGYIEEIIMLGKEEKPGGDTKSKGPELIEMESISPPPSVAKSKFLDLDNNDWVIVQEEEAQCGDFVGMQWSVPMP
ncbi:hypothetical protein H4Q26_016947 [Puccinia striiformis f. sp. tritici PST-130]|nr:hypothetical protein Pst134EB_028321 [Puccinia striiformis f. sp. tritici]KAI9624240.1 hypothetical protein H4Q26_016947 [Puccinia striiformis f. sp. tritici PST-130]